MAAAPWVFFLRYWFQSTSKAPESLPFLPGPFWGGLIFGFSLQNLAIQVRYRNRCFFKVVTLVRKSAHLPPEKKTFTAFSFVFLQAQQATFHWLDDSPSDSTPERRSGTWRCPEPMEKWTFHFCCFLTWGAEFLDTAGRERIHLQQNEAFAQNSHWELRGVAKIKKC